MLMLQDNQPNAAPEKLLEDTASMLEFKRLVAENHVGIFNTDFLARVKNIQASLDAK